MTGYISLSLCYGTLWNTGIKNGEIAESVAHSNEEAVLQKTVVNSIIETRFAEKCNLQIVSISSGVIGR